MQFERTRAQIQQMVTNQVIPGASYALLTGAQVFEERVGVAQVQPTRLPLWAHARYDLASLTKVIGTTTVALQLLAQGKLAIDRPVHDYLPDFENRRVTLRHLMTHTSGISGYIPNRNQLAAPQLLRAVQALPISDQNLGHRVVYTDLGLILTGLIIEQIEHAPIQTVITQRVLRPLALPDATFHPQAELAVPTVCQADGQPLRGTVHDPKGRILGAHCGSAGLFASVADLVRFSRLLLGQLDVPTVLTQTQIKQLYQDWTPNGRLSRSFGWNLWYRQPDQPVIFHTGYTGTLIMLDRQTQSGLVFLSNRIHPVVDDARFLPERRRLIAAWLADTLPQN
ncbi:serine hydrolase domain-containing protein [Lactiplantibacillus modestisalitolerans]|uniref:Serine hydrolase domain-containing protein n=1 Tax=Lactiplantibacillus modestisalitolerans TaxID=1457219 RepID=A0ABV5WW56_9LACO|nr:serine hydrolase domain-containing protein [Lactiplantibacillus modestisalitolerans]